MMPQHAESRSQISRDSRAAALLYLGDDDTELDVLVVGGGVTGAGAALDATTRGLNTAIIEADDWASGTSSRSSKLIHGGIRYLEQLNFSLVSEALAERTLLLRTIAPHLVRPIRFAYPLRRPLLERLYVGAGMFLYDALSKLGGAKPGVPGHKHYSRKQLAKKSPGLKPGIFHGALSYSDAQVDDARLVIALVRTAVKHGATAASQLRAVSYLREADRVVGVLAEDQITGNLMKIRAKQVISATGVWTNDNAELLGESVSLRVRASQGVHIVVPNDRFESSDGLLLRTSGSVLFVIPWGEFWLIGTTDTTFIGDVSQPQATENDVSYILDQVNTVLADPLTRKDVVSVFAGLRPLVASAPGPTSRISREHRIEQPVPGLTLIAGGKLTTYRVMAADVVDTAMGGLTNIRASRSTTADLPLLGAEGIRVAWNRRFSTAKASGLTDKQFSHLLRRYGTLCEELLDLIAADDSLANPLDGAPQTLRAEVVYAATHEGALNLQDVLERRIHIAMETPDWGSAVAEEVAEVLADHLGWDAAEQLRQVTRYREQISHEWHTQLPKQQLR